MTGCNVSTGVATGRRNTKCVLSRMWAAPQVSLCWTIEKQWCNHGQMCWQISQLLHAHLHQSMFFFQESSRKWAKENVNQCSTRLPNRTSASVALIVHVHFMVFQFAAYGHQHVRSAMSEPLLCVLCLFQQHQGWITEWVLKSCDW